MPMIRTSVLAAGILLVSQTGLVAQNWGRPQPPQSGACFYEDIDYGGNYFCMTIGTSNPQVTYRMNNRISSIRLFGDAEVTVYLDTNFRGRSRTFGSDVIDLRRAGYNDNITSFRVLSTKRTLPSWLGRWGRPSTPSSGVCFYEHSNFEGQYFCVREGERVEMVPEGTNDRISSMQLFGGAEITVFRDRDFRGFSQHFGSSARDLRQTGWNDTISSFRVEARGFGRPGRGQGQPQGRGSGGGPVTSESATGRVEWRGVVDDRVQLVIRGRSIEHRTMSGRAFPDGRFSFTSPLPNDNVRVEVINHAARGTTRVIQQPARTNGFTAIIEIYDPQSGEREYRLEVIWR